MDDVVKLVLLEQIGLSEVKVLTGYLCHDKELIQRLKTDGQNLTPPEYLGETELWCEQRNARLYAIILRDYPVGTISLVLQADGGARTGYWIASKYWGQGVGRQAFGLLLREAENANVSEVGASIEIDNIPSLSLWRKFGACEKLNEGKKMIDVTLRLTVVHKR